MAPALVGVRVFDFGHGRLCGGAEAKAARRDGAMINRFELELPENGFGFPCNICKHRVDDVAKCRECVGYSGPFVCDKVDIKRLMETKPAEPARGMA
jgi:hypothetical protein